MSAVPGDGGVRYLADDDGSFPDELDLSLVRSKAWRLQIRGGRAAFQDLTRDEAAVLSASFDSSRVRWNLFKSLGDLVEGIADAVAEASDWVFKTVGNGIEVSIRFLIRGVEYGFKQVVETVTEVLHVVEAVLRAVAVAFQRVIDLFGWLLSGAREDIWRTTLGLEKLLRESFVGMDQRIQAAKDVEADYFAKMRDTLESRFEELLEFVGDMTLDPDLLQSAGAMLPATPDGRLPDLQKLFADNAISVNWFFDKLMTAVELDSNFPEPKSLIESIEALLKRLSEEVFSILEEAIESFVSFLENLASDPKELMRTPVRVILETAKGLLLDTLSLIDALVGETLEVADGVLSYLREEIFDLELDSWLIEEVFRFLSGGEDTKPTIGRVALLLPAFPTTILYRLVTGEAPFAASEDEGDASITTFKYYHLVACLIFAKGFIDVVLDLIDPILSKVPRMYLVLLLAASIAGPLILDAVSFKLWESMGLWLDALLGLITPLAAVAFAIYSYFSSGGKKIEGLRGKPQCLILVGVGVLRAAICFLIGLANNFEFKKIVLVVCQPLVNITKAAYFAKGNPWAVLFMTTFSLIAHTTASVMTIQIGDEELQLPFPDGSAAVLEA